MHYRPRKTFLAAAAATLALLGHRITAAAQAGVARPAAAMVSVHGLAYDSVGKQPLGAAFITIAGGGRNTTTDALGRFQFDSIVPGVYTFGMQHDALDSLGLSGAAARVAVSDGRDDIVIAVPSFATLWRATCGAKPPPTDSGFVYGTVRDAISGRRVPGAAVELSWPATEVDTAPDVAQRRWRIQAHTDANGTYGMCGVPPMVSLRARASADSSASGAIDLPPRGSRVRRRDLLIGPAGAADSAHLGTILGTVTDTAGVPVRDARIVMDEAPEARSGPDGHFVVRDVPPGTRELAILSVGMLPAIFVVDVVPPDSATVAAQLRRVTTLNPVKITAAERRQQFIADFEDRRKTGFGYAMDSTAISKSGTIGAAFGGFPSVTVQVAKRGPASRFTIGLPAFSGGGLCTAIVWIDGVKQVDSNELNALHPDEIAAIEVYPHALSVPPQFATNGRCGAVLVWTKRGFS